MAFDKLLRNLKLENWIPIRHAVGSLFSLMEHSNKEERGLTLGAFNDNKFVVSYI